MTALRDAGEFRAGKEVRDAFAEIRKRIDFMPRDRAMDADVQAMSKMVMENTLTQ